MALVGPIMIDPNFWAAFGLTGVLLVAQAFYGLYLIPMNYLVQTAGTPRYSSVASIAGATIILSGTLVIGAQAGANGVAVVTLLGFIVMAMMSYLLVVVVRLQISWRQLMLSPVQLSLAVLGLAAQCSSLMLPTSSPAALVLGAAAVIFSGTMVAMEWRRGLMWKSSIQSA